MAISGLYRDWIPFYSTNGGSGGTWDVSGPIWVKGNVQPYKQETTVYDTASGIITISSESYRQAWTRQDPFPDETIGDGRTYYFWDMHNNVLYRVNGEQDWRYSGRNPKNIQWIGTTDNENGVIPITLPIPDAKLVDEFESVTRRLAILASMYNAEQPTT